LFHRPRFLGAGNQLIAGALGMGRQLTGRTMSAGRLQFGIFNSLDANTKPLGKMSFKPVLMPSRSKK
jgi:hypothetical protein